MISETRADEQKHGRQRVEDRGPHARAEQYKGYLNAPSTGADAAGDDESYTNRQVMPHRSDLYARVFQSFYGFFFPLFVC